MKKALLFAFIAFSLNVFAQSKLSDHQKLLTAANPIERLQNRMLDLLSKTQGVNPDLYNGSVQNPEQLFVRPWELVDSAFNWKWDATSMAWKLKSKSTKMVYDNNYNLTSATIRSWNGTAWKDSILNTATYNANRGLLVSLVQSWTAGAWVNKTQLVNIYDANNNHTSFTMQIWAGGTWVNYAKFSWTYDVHYNKTSETMQNWTAGAWENYIKINWTYDAKNNMILEEDPTWNATSGLWEKTTQFPNTYDANNYQSTNTWQETDDGGITWRNVMRTLYSYDPAHNYNKIKELHESWVDPQWDTAWQYNYAYDANNNLINELDRNYFNPGWMNARQYTYTYDTKRNQLSALIQNWGVSSWLKFNQDLQTYDANSYPKGISHKMWDNAGTKVSAGDSTYNYYHLVTTGLSLPVEANVLVYPNPSHGKITISSNIAANAVEIYSLTGKRIYADYNFKLKTSNEIDLTGYAKGIYILRVHNGTKIYNSKVVVQ